MLDSVSEYFSQSTPALIPSDSFSSPKKTTRLNLPKGYTRVSMYFTVTQFKQIQIYAWWHRMPVKKVIDLALTDHLAHFSNHSDAQEILTVKEPFKRTTIVIKDLFWEQIKEIAWKNKSLTKYVLANVLLAFFKDKELPSSLPESLTF